MKYNITRPFFVLIFLFPCILPAQNQHEIHSQFYTFQIHLDTSLQNLVRIDSVLVLEKNSRQLQQVIQIDSEPFAAPFKDWMFRIVDCNFDGREDLQILWWNGMYSSKWLFFRYDPDKEYFYPVPELTNHIDPWLDQENQIIHYSWRVGLQEFGHAVYKWLDGRCVLLVEEIEYLEMELEGSTGRVLSSKVWKNGQYEEGNSDPGSLTRHLECDVLQRLGLEDID